MAVALLLLSARTVGGQVLDGATGQPVAGAVVRADGQEVRADESGSFTLSGLRLGSTVVAEARGYNPASRVVAMDGQLRLRLAPRVMEGVALDASTGRPVEGVQIVADSLSVVSDEQGRFRLVGVEPGTEVQARVEGYRSETIRYRGRQSADLSLEPNALVVVVSNRYTGEPLSGVEVADGRGSVRTDRQGQARLLYLREGARVEVKLEGFEPAEVAFTGQERADVSLRPDTVAGVVKDSGGRPIAGASVSDGRSTAITDERGAFKLSGVAENARLSVSATGYERRQLEPGRQTSVEVSLQPFSARGLYLTFYGVGSDELREHVLHLADTTEVNAVVIDVKGDRGWLAYRSSVPMVQQIGAQREIMIPDPRGFLAELKRRGVYSIARIVVFKDNPLATARPDLAVVNSATGRPWVDNEGLAWADPTREEVWDYNTRLAVEAIELGFDEVQFDYIRFPTDASAGNTLDTMTFSRANTPENRVASINGFLERASRAIKAAGGNVSIDIFGYVVWRTQDDMGIGQKLEDMAGYVDFVSPMVYPNLFWHGLPMEDGVKYGNRQSGLYPYEIVYESLKVAVQRIGAAKLRPWLQYYDDYITGKSYTADDMVAQKRATYENGITGWLFWDPTNRFAKGGFEPR